MIVSGEVHSDRFLSGNRIVWNRLMVLELIYCMRYICIDIFVSLYFSFCSTCPRLRTLNSGWLRSCSWCPAQTMDGTRPQQTNSSPSIRWLEKWAGISNYIHYKVWDEITYPFPNFNGAVVEGWKWISNFIPHFYWACDYLTMLVLKLIHVSKRDGWMGGFSVKLCSYVDCLAQYCACHLHC